MKRFLKILPVLAAVAFFTSCKNDDNASTPTPPRDYAVQYAVEKADIEEYLATHYVKEITANMDVVFDEIQAGDGNVAIKDRTDILRSKQVVKEGVTYTVYYLMLREGIGKQPTRADQIMPAYTGMLLDGTVFDSQPFPADFWVLTSLIEGWQEIMPMFKSGVLEPASNPADPAVYTDYGAAVMFLPSALAYYNTARGLAPAYSTMIFSFKLYDAKFVDTDGDGIESRFERVLDPLNPNTDVADLDTDSDGIPNYKDTDDDGDGFLTKDEIGYTAGQPPVVYDDIKDCSGVTTTGTKKHVDKNCH